MPDPTKDWEGDWLGSCRVCWRVRNMGPDWRPKSGDAVVTCGLKNPDGQPCTGRLLISLSPDAKKRVAAARRQKKASEFNRGK